MWTLLLAFRKLKAGTLLGLLSCFLTMNSFTLFSQDEIPSFVKDSLDSYVLRALAEWKIPGCAVGIVKNGKIILAKGYGLRDVQTGQAVDEHTLFMIASNSKAVTGIAMAKLAHEKKLRLDDKVQKWIPEFRLADPHISAMVNLRDVLSHRIGFETFQGDFCHWATNTSSKQVIERMARVKPVYEFRDHYGYCNAGYAVAGEVIRRASGMNWEDYVARNFFEKLGMTETRPLSMGFSSAPNHCQPYTLYYDTLYRLQVPNIDNLAPAASICSSVADWSKWVLMLLGKGKYGGQEIVPEAAIRMSMEPISLKGSYRPRFNKGHFMLYGMGWELTDYEGRKVVAHTGGADGFVTAVTLLPEEELGVIVFTNTDANSFYYALKMEIMDAFLGLPYRNYSQMYRMQAKKNEEGQANWLRSVRDSVKEMSTSVVSLKEFTGSYKNELYGKVNLQIEDGKLIMTMEHHPGQTALLEPMGSDRFLCTYSNPTLGIKVFPFKRELGKPRFFDLTCAEFVDMAVYSFMKE